MKTHTCRKCGAVLMTPKQIAQDYADTIYGPPNGWGQHVSKKSGMVSHAIMRRLRLAVGEEEADRLIDEAMKTHQALA